jgi:hypothetical protein
MIHGKTHMMKVLKPIDKHFNLSIIGILVLAMSKRIMNEVMCLAEDIGCMIYYQDTDSIHIPVTDLAKLVPKFREIYHRELVGSDLGNFHSDFPEIEHEVPIAVESYIVGKKIYVDKLMNSKNMYGYHTRCKGISKAAIIEAASREFLDMYNKIIRGQYGIEGREFIEVTSTMSRFCDMVNKVQKAPNCTDTAMRISLDILNKFITELIDEKKQETMHKVCGVAIMRLYKKLYDGEVTSTLIWLALCSNLIIPMISKSSPRRISLGNSEAKVKK